LSTTPSRDGALSPKVGVALLTITWFCWGFSYPATKIGLTVLDPWSFRLTIMFGAAATLLLLGRAFGKSLAIPRAQWRDLAIAAFFNMTVFQIAMTFGVHWFSAGRTAVIVYTMPLWATLIAWPVLGERPTAPRIAALGLGLAGLAILMSQDFAHLTDAPAGAACTLVAAVSFAIGTVWMKRTAWVNDPGVVAGWQLLIGVLPLCVLALLFATPPDLGAVTTEAWVSIGYQILFANTLAYLAWFRVVRIFPATVSGIGSMAVPIVGLFSSALLVGEVIGWRELAALALVCGALAINLATARRG
jgi:drug/metabolite transporter (DMT)-like permease